MALALGPIGGFSGPPDIQNRDKPQLEFDEFLQGVIALMAIPGAKYKARSRDRPYPDS